MKNIDKDKLLTKKRSFLNSETRYEKRKKTGKLNARQRLNLLFDNGSFQEINAFVTHKCVDFGMENKKIEGDGVITGYGNINGRLCYAFAQDFTVIGGSLGRAHADKIIRILDLAIQNGAPIIGLNDSGGARIQEGVASLGGYADIFYRNVSASGVIPQITAILGPCAGGAVYSPGLNDFIFMLEDNAYMFLTGPNVIKEVTGEESSFDTLGGAEIHSSKSGVAQFMCENETKLFEDIRKLFDYLPLNNLEDPPILDFLEADEPEIDDINAIMPDSSDQPYNIKEIINKIFDKESFYEVHENYAQNIVVGFARIKGFPVGIVANNPSFLAGVLDIDSSCKASRFIRFCDAFNFPIISLIDVPGFLPGVSQEHNGIIRNGAKLLYAYSEATVPKIGIILRKAYGGAYCVMSSKHLGSDMNFAWPTAEIAVMGPEGACNIIFKKDIANSENPNKKREELVNDYKNNFANPYVAASLGYIDEVIFPEETREKIIYSLKQTINKRVVNPSRKHGNIPV